MNLVHKQILSQEKSAINIHYQQAHQRFINDRVKNLKHQLIKRKGKIIPCNQLLIVKDQKAREAQYFEIIKQTLLELHSAHAVIDTATGKKVSFGVVRMANISPCVNLAKYLLQTDWPPNYAPKIMAYHSRQILLLRHEQEEHLDQVLKRKEKSDEMPKVFNHPLIRKHINNTIEPNLIFILVATPVEEIGRDHDFDWAIIEPSSYRSIIQLAGRVRRHRKGEVIEANVAIMQYNLKALEAAHQPLNKPVFYRPGYETHKSLRLKKHNLDELINIQEISHSINAIPRICQRSETLNPAENLADLEHQSLIASLKNYEAKGPEALQGW